MCSYVPVLCCQHDTIDKVLQRGEKLDDLVEKSEELGLQSKTFYKTVLFLYLFFLHSDSRTSFMIANIPAACVNIFFSGYIFILSKVTINLDATRFYCAFLCFLLFQSKDMNKCCVIL